MGNWCTGLAERQSIWGIRAKYKFYFSGGEEVLTDKLADIDKPLLAAFLKRVEEDGRMPKAAA